jgi:hypothetical protein
LEHPYFANFRDISFEKTAEEPPTFSWDNKDVTIEEIREHFKEEIAQYN